MRLFYFIGAIILFSCAFSQEVGDISNQIKNIRDSINTLTEEYEQTLKLYKNDFQKLDNRLKSLEQLRSSLMQASVQEGQLINADQLNYSFILPSDANIYENKTAASKLVFSAIKGDTLEFIEVYNSAWWKVRKGIQIGYLNLYSIQKFTPSKAIKDSVRAYLDPIEKQSEVKNELEEERKKLKIIQETSSTCNLYTQASTGSKVAFSVGPNTQLNVLSTLENNWLKVRYQNNEVYVNRSSLSSIARIFSFNSSKNKVYSSKDLQIPLDGFANVEIEIVSVFDKVFRIKNSNGQLGYIKKYDVNQWYLCRSVLETNEFDKLVKKGIPLIIKDIQVKDINSASGVDFTIMWRFVNIKKIIKYIYFTVVPYNAVGDIQKCDIKDKSAFTGKVTGPIQAGPGEVSYWGTAWYNNTISCLKLTKVKVIYTDGTQYTYINELPKILADDFKNSCKYN